MRSKVFEKRLQRRITIIVAHNCIVGAAKPGRVGWALSWLLNTPINTTLDNGWTRMGMKQGEHDQGDDHILRDGVIYIYMCLTYFVSK